MKPKLKFRVLSEPDSPFARVRAIARGGEGLDEFQVVAVIGMRRPFDQIGKGEVVRPFAGAKQA